MAKKPGSKKKTAKKSDFPSAETYTLTKLDQVKVLADPLRVRLLEAFCLEQTTKQVADQLGEKSTKLYHHVDALERVGLIRLTRTRQNRGTLEKYYQSVARSFRADPQLFLSADREAPQAGAMQTMISNLFGNVTQEIGAIVNAAQGMQGLEEEGVMAHCEVRATEADIKKLQRRLNRLVKSLIQDDEEDENLDDLRRYRLVLAFYPLDWASHYEASSKKTR
jgi:predicted transcriptional regulator